MKLSEKRATFTKYVPLLINYAIALGFHPAMDEGKTDREEDDDHMKNSLHHEGLALDLILYDQDWNYLTTWEDYKELGPFWENLHPNCRWGGRFGESEPGKGDGKDSNHFSMSWDARK